MTFLKVSVVALKQSVAATRGVALLFLSRDFGLASLSGLIVNLISLDALLTFVYDYP